MTVGKWQAGDASGCMRDDREKVERFEAEARVDDDIKQKTISELFEVMPLSHVFLSPVLSY